MKKQVYILCCMLFYSIGVIAETNQKESETLVYAPVTFTQQGVQDFFKNTLNTTRYRQDMLPNNFSHLVQFVDHGLKRCQGRAYTQSIMRLFNNALKGSMYVNAYAFDECIEKLIPLLYKQCVVQAYDPTAAMKKRINDVLYANFLNNFGLFKKDPDSFLSDVAGTITDITASAQAQQLFDGGDISNQDFRKTLMTFLEHSLGKLVWDPKSGIESWKSVKKIADSIEKLLDQKILIDEDDVNDLCVSLVERYCLFLDINAAQFSIDCYKEIKQDVLAQNLYFLELDEQESFLEKKSQRMLRALCECEAKTRAAEYGIVVT